MNKLEEAAGKYRFWKDELAYTKEEFEKAKALFIQEFEKEHGDTGSFAARDGYTYGRIAKTVGGGFDFDRFMKEHPGYARLVSKHVLDEEKLQEFVEAREELRPLVSQYAIPGTTQLALMPVRATKDVTEDE